MSVLRRLVSLRYGRRNGDTMRGSRRGYDLALLRAEDKFREVLRAAGDRPPPVLDRIVCEQNFVDWCLEFRARFISHDGVTEEDVRWVLERWMFEDSNFIGRHPRDFGDQYIRDCRSLYSRLYEDHLMELELRPRREIVQELLRLNADPAIVQQAQRNYEDFAAHLRRHHHTDRSYAQQLTSQMREIRPDRMAADMRRHTEAMFSSTLYGSAQTSNNLVAEPLTEASLLRSMEELRRMPRVHERFGYGYIDPRGLFGGSSEVGTPAAQAKGLDLLKSWLTPDQKASYEKHKHFEVKGSDTGKRYRIRHGRQMNIDELDSSGNKVRGLCALPEGGVVSGDCMLAQKLTLETNEKQFLAVANVV